MTDLGPLIAILDIVVLERLPGGAFAQIGREPTPSWFAEAFRAVSPDAPVTLLQAFPVLDAFLSEADVFWSRNQYGRVDGETFVVSRGEGRNLALAAIAVALHGRHFLLIQRVPGFDDRQHILQRAREQALAHEQVVKEIDALRVPFGRAAARVGDLERSTEMSESDRTVLGAVRVELDTVQRLLDGLPKLPPGASARRR
jgi:hypothetical protein